MLLPSLLSAMSNLYPFHDAVPFDSLQRRESLDLLQIVHSLPNYGMGTLCLPDTAVPAEGPSTSVSPARHKYNCHWTSLPCFSWPNERKEKPTMGIRQVVSTTLEWKVTVNNRMVSKDTSRIWCQLLLPIGNFFSNPNCIRLYVESFHAISG